jgi:hypothetical protein
VARGVRYAHYPSTALGGLRLHAEGAQQALEGALIGVVVLPGAEVADIAVVAQLACAFGPSVVAGSLAAEPLDR